MKIALCIKQVPGSTSVEIDEKTGVLKRDGVAAKINPFDLPAIECALWLKEKTGGDITAVTMGPPQSEAVIREAFMMGVDHGIMLSDRRFGGADVLATSYTLAQGLRSCGEKFDLIICGKQTTDGDTAQVGAELAEFLGIPHLNNICAVEKAEDGFLYAVSEQPLEKLRLKIKLPCLISVEKNIFEPRLPSYKLKKLTAGRKIKLLTLDDLEDKDPEHYGLNGSPTQVKRIFPPEHNTEHVFWQDGDVDAAGNFFNLLKENKYLQFLR